MNVREKDVENLASNKTGTLTVYNTFIIKPLPQNSAKSFVAIKQDYVINESLIYNITFYITTIHYVFGWYF